MKVTLNPWLAAESTYHSFEDKDKISATQYKHILDLFGILLFKTIIERKEVVRLPYGIGNILLKSYPLKANARQLDYQHFQTTGEVKIVKRNSMQLDGYLRTSWDKRKAVAPTLSYLAKYVQFKPNRIAKTRINKYIKTLSSLVEYNK